MKTYTDIVYKQVSKIVEKSNEYKEEYSQKPDSFFTERTDYFRQQIRKTKHQIFS